MKKRWNNGLSSSLTRECADYFRERPVFDRLLRGFREKYMSYGSFSGTVTVRNLSEEDIEDLEGFFQKNFHGQKSVSISDTLFLYPFAFSSLSRISCARIVGGLFEHNPFRQVLHQE